MVSWRKIVCQFLYYISQVKFPCDYLIMYCGVCYTIHLYLNIINTLFFFKILDKSVIGLESTVWLFHSFKEPLACIVKILRLFKYIHSFWKVWKAIIRPPQYAWKPWPLKEPTKSSLLYAAIAWPQQYPLSIWDTIWKQPGTKPKKGNNPCHCSHWVPCSELDIRSLCGKNFFSRR